MPDVPCAIAELVADEGADAATLPMRLCRKKGLDLGVCLTGAGSPPPRLLLPLLHVALAPLVTAPSGVRRQAGACPSAVALAAHHDAVVAPVLAVEIEEVWPPVLSGAEHGNVLGLGSDQYSDFPFCDGAGDATSSRRHRE
jgi:hypothetical protein